MEFPACKQINKQSNGEKTMKQIEVRGDRVHNLKNIDVNMPLNKIVGIAGASGLGKSSLVLWRWVCCMLRAPVAIWSRYRLTQGAE